MEAREAVRILWGGEEPAARVFPGRDYCVESVRPAQRAVGLVRAAEAAGAPFAVGFLPWGPGGVGTADVGTLLQTSPDLHLVIEGEASELPNPGELGLPDAPERCVTLCRPAQSVVLRSLADHLGARWRERDAQRRRIERLEDEASLHRASRRRYEERLRVLYGIVEKLHGAAGPDGGLGVALEEMAGFLGARTGSLLLLDGGGKLRVVEAVGPNHERILGLDIPLQESRISRYALEGREPILVGDMQGNPRFRESADAIRFRARSILSVPIFNHDAPLGVLNFGAEDGAPSFTEEDRDVVVTVGRQFAVALERTRLMAGLKEAVGESIRALAGAIEAKDPYTRGHSDRVTHYARLIGHAMGLAPAELDLLVRAAILHDVGKIGVPGNVLNKPGRLTDEEYRQIQRHPEEGVKIVREIGAMAETVEIIRSHHERFDGSGYPHGVCGRDIPLGARILAVADTYDAMTVDRPYREGLSSETAYAEIARCSGSQFDPDVARVFLEGAPRWPDLEPGAAAEG